MNKFDLEIDDKKPLIFWDGFGLKDPHSGIWVHANALGLELKKLSVNPVLIVQNEIFPPPAELNQHVLGDCWLSGIRSKLPFPKSKPAEQLFAQIQNDKKFIYHGLCNFNLPIHTPKPINARYVLTVHDIIPIIAPSEFSIWQPLRAKYFLSRALPLADKVICVSEWTKKCLLDFYPAVENKVIVIPNGCDHLAPMTIKKMESQPAETIRILAVSRFERYKRFDLIFEVIKRLPQNYRMSLVTNDRGLKHARRYAMELIRSGRLKIFTKLSDEEIAYKFQRSDIFLHPSRYEGFCIPAVEAILHELPVVYQKGSGIDDTIGEGLGIGLSRTAKIDEWVEATLLAKRLRESESYSSNVRAYRDKLPKWRDVASKTEEIYLNL